MKTKCINHPTRDALSFCKSCGEYYCADCLHEGVEYYYCDREACQQIYQQELAGLEIICPNCGAEVTLAPGEKRAAVFQCPNCRKKVVTLGLIDEDEDSIKETLSDIEKHLLSLNTRDNPSLGYRISYNSSIDVLLEGRNAYSLQHHFNHQDTVFQTTRNDLTLAEAAETIFAFKNLKHGWGNKFEWEAHPAPGRVKWFRRLLILKPLLRPVMIVLLYLLLIIVVGLIGSLLSFLWDWVYKIF